MRRFITDASHELRTPLTTIRGFAELYRQGAARDVEMLMGRIESESRRMGLLVEDLLLLARLDAQRPLERSRVDLLALASDAVHDAQVDRAGPHHHHGGLRRPGHPGGARRRGRLRQVLGNLVANALQHTPETAVTVRVGTDGDDAVLEVVDKGPGMTRGRPERVFERFYRTDRPGPRRHQRRHRAGAVDRRGLGRGAQRDRRGRQHPGRGLDIPGEAAASESRVRKRGPALNRLATCSSGG